MMNTFLFLFYLAAIVSTVLYSAQGDGNYKDVNHYQYAITWAPTYCKYLINKKCRSDLPQRRFVMHGIWAGDVNGRTVDDCKAENGERKPPLSGELLKRFNASLSVSWPPIIEGQSGFALWGHEYNKHGVCFQGWMGSDYLGFADRVSVNNNITKLLETSGIRKSSTVKYSRNAIEKTIQGKIGAGFRMYLGCQKVGTMFYLKSASLCIKKKENTKYMTMYEFISCPQKNDQYNNCGGGMNEEENIFLLP